MSETKVQHTQGRMSWKRRADGSLFYVIGDHKTGPHAQGDIHIGEDDMRHIAACWNACDGSKTEDLEALGPDYIKPLNRLIDLRDELLAALQIIAKTSPIDAALDPQRAVRVARAAIAKATGSAA